MGGSIVPWFLLDIWIFRECWMAVTYFTDLFDRYAQGEMLGNVKSCEKRPAGIDDLSNPQGIVDS